MKLNLTPLPIDRFTIHREPGRVPVLVAEMSDFGHDPEPPYNAPFPLQRLYDDACDLGIAIQGKTRVAEFVISKEERDHEGELLYIELAPCPGHEIVGCRVHLYND